MHDKELVVDILKNIVWSLEQISKRFQAIRSSEDFIKDDFGIEKLDSICMQLINIGEALKQIDKDIDAETVFTVCAEHVPTMKEVIIRVTNDLKE